MALTLSEHSNCPGCGHPKSKAWIDADDADELPIVDDHQCLVCARLEAVRAGKKTEKGIHHTVEWVARNRGEDTSDPPDPHDDLTELDTPA